MSGASKKAPLVLVKLAQPVVFSLSPRLLARSAATISRSLAIGELRFVDSLVALKAFEKISVGAPRLACELSHCTGLTIN